MPRSSHRIVLSALLAAALASPSSAAIVRVKYEGIVNVVGAATTGFAIGDRIWGEYFYDSTSPSIVGANSLLSEHAAIRFLSVNASNGFAGAVNFGVIKKRTFGPPYFHPNFGVYAATTWPAIVSRASEGSVTNLPGLVLRWGGGVLDGDGIADDIDRDGQFGPDGIDFETPGGLPSHYNGPDLDSLYHAAVQSASLGFPAPSGAFMQGNPVSIHLTTEGIATPASAADPLATPTFTTVYTAKGSIYFGSFGTDNPYFKVEFALTNIRVVPEPNSAVILAIGSLAIIRCIVAQRTKVISPLVEFRQE